jgi:hypothetical protein
VGWLAAARLPLFVLRIPSMALTSRVASRVAYQNACALADLGIYSRHSCCFASSICSWSGCLAG